VVIEGIFLWRTEQNGWWYMAKVCFHCYDIARFSFWWLPWEFLGRMGLHTRKEPEVLDFYANDT
jgi:hypothetical protein